MPFTPVPMDRSERPFGKAPADSMPALSVADTLLQQFSNATQKPNPYANDPLGRAPLTPAQREARRTEMNLADRKRALEASRRGQSVFLVYPQAEQFMGADTNAPGTYDLEHPREFSAKDYPGGQFDPAVLAEIEKFNARVAPTVGGKMNLTPLQQLAYFTGNLYPSIGSFTGGLGGGAKSLASLSALARQGDPARFTEELAQTMPGIVAGSAIGRGVGAGARYAQYRAAGIPVIQDPKDVAVHLVNQAALGGLEGALQSTIGAAVPRAGEQMVKSVFGEAEPTVPEIARKYNLAVTRRNWMPKGTIDKMIDTADEQYRAIAQDLTARGVTIPEQQFVQSLTERVNQAAGNLANPSARESLMEGLQNVLSKIRGRAVAGSGGGRGTYVASEPLTPTRLQEIKSELLKAIRKYAADRSKNMPAEEVRKISALEEAEYTLYNGIRGILDELDPRLTLAGKTQNELYTLQNAMREVAYRTPRSQLTNPANYLGIAGGVAAMQGNVPAALTAGGASAAMHLAGQPAPWSRIGLLLQNPTVAQAFANAPKVGMGAFEAINPPFVQQPIMLPNGKMIYAGPLGTQSDVEQSWYPKYGETPPPVRR